MHVVTAGPTFPVREAKSIKRSFHPEFNEIFDVMIFLNEILRTK